MSDLDIRPQTASLTAGETQQFEAFQDGKSVQGAQWSLQPNDAGTINDSGLYTAPKSILPTQQVMVKAEKGDASGSAAIELKPARVAGAQGDHRTLWTTILGIYLLACLGITLGIVICKWEDLCPTCKPGRVRVSPPVVTLMPSQSQLFTANIPVTWSSPGLSQGVEGLFKAPPVDASGVGKVQFVATRKGQPSAAAEVFLSSKGSLSLQPSQATVTTGGSIDLTAVAVPPPPAPPTQAPQVSWLNPAIGTLTPSSPNSLTARFSVAASAVDRPTTILVLAQIADDPNRTAGAWITVKPASLLTGVCEDGDCYDIGGLLFLLSLMGALGAIVHAISSFTAFVGNREFQPSWIWWYIFKPFLGGLVALAVFLVFRAGFGLGSFSLDTADCLKSAALAILIGLFSELATIKLKDVFEALFTPRSDQRQDSLGGGKPSVPTLVSLDPSTATVGQDLKILTLHGTGFAPDCQVKIGNSDPRKPSSTTATVLIVPLKPEDLAKDGKVPVIVYNKAQNGDPSNTLQLEVLPAKSDGVGNQPVGAGGGNQPPGGKEAQGEGKS
jgi:hypothetical protein